MSPRAVEFNVARAVLRVLERSASPLVALYAVRVRSLAIRLIGERA